eukprot:3516395-Rhodomonas_salina.1
MQQKEIPSVLYGDEVCLSELDLGGIVCGDADVTESVFLDKEINFVPGEAVHNQQLCQFKLLPKFQYTAAKAFRRRLQRSQVKLDSSNWATKLDPCEQLYKDLARDKKQIDDEQATLSRCLLCATMLLSHSSPAVNPAVVHPAPPHFVFHVHRRPMRWRQHALQACM